MSTFQDSSESTIFAHEMPAMIGSEGMLAVQPVVTAVGPGSITQQYAATFDYLQSFTADNLGYRTFAKDLAYIEMWAADQGGGAIHKFYCDKTPAIEIPITGIVPTYNGRWTKLGEGRTYNLFVRYQHKDGNSSMFSNAVATGITNLGIGQPALATNPSPTSAPAVTSSTIDVDSTGSASTQVIQIGLHLTPPTPYQWIKYVCIWAVPASTPAAGGPLPPPYMPPTVRVPFRADGTYASSGTNAIRMTVPQAVYGGGYNLFVGYEDFNSNWGGVTQINNVTPALMSDVYVRTIAGAVTWYIGSGPPGSFNPGTASPAIYANTAAGAAHGALLYAWNGSTWSAFA